LWENGRQHGEGVYITQDGISRKGIWKNGKRLQWLDGNEAEGDQAEEKKAEEMS